MGGRQLADGHSTGALIPVLPTRTELGGLDRRTQEPINIKHPRSLHRHQLAPNSRSYVVNREQA